MTEVMAVKRNACSPILVTNGGRVIEAMAVALKAANSIKMY
jgi:hypothetical protein